MGKNHARGGYRPANKWTTGEERRECKNCDFIKNDNGYAIKIHPTVFASIFFLCEKIETEWQMLLKGVETEADVIVNGYFIPKQEVTGSTVKNLDAIDEEFIIENDIVATIHSHSSMGVFFSTTDDEFTNMSHIRHHIVVNNKHELKAKSRYDLPCGMAKFADSKVMSLIPAVESVEGIEKISKKTYVGFHNNHNGFNTRSKSKVFPKIKDSLDDDFVRNKWGVWVKKSTLTAEDLAELIRIEDYEEEHGPKDGQIEYFPHGY